MSWAPMGIVLDPFHFLLTHKVKNNYYKKTKKNKKNNYYNDDNSKQI